jgi:hypothetical protein
MTRLLLIPLILYISSCAESEEVTLSKKQEIDSLYKAAKEIPETDSCKKADKLMEMLELENRYKTFYYVESMFSESQKYKADCQRQSLEETTNKNKEAEEVKQELTSANNYTDSPEYKYEKDCIGTLSYARDYAFDSGQQNAYKLLTSLQNDFYLKRPQGYFPSMHITAWKILVKNRTKERGMNYLNSSLKKCGWTGALQR